MNTIKRGDIKNFKEYLNRIGAEYPNHRNGRYHQLIRPYGEYLYHQDREMFDVELNRWIDNGRPI